MEILNIPPSRVVGELKESIKNAIFDEEIANTYEAAHEYLLYLAKKNQLI